MLFNGGVQGKMLAMQKWRGLAVVAGVVLGLSGAARADWADDAAAAAAYARGDYRAAITNLMPRAEQGDARAQDALAFMYANGQGFHQDYYTAAIWYTLAAEQDFVNAKYNLGLMYHNGQGVAQDYKTAVKWYTQAAEQGLAPAQNALGILYETGLGVAQDYKIAVKMYTLSAEQGLAASQYNLGVMYEHGRGVAQDYVKAHMWYNIAAIFGRSQKAAPIRDAIAKKMFVAQVARAQELATKCVAQSFKNCGS